jgi:hypothetical protein
MRDIPLLEGGWVLETIEKKKIGKEIDYLFCFTGRIGRTVFPFASFKTSARPR